MATMTAFAQEEPEGWEKSFTPVASASDLAGMCTAVAADGAVYASSTYDQVFQFAGKDVKDPEGLLSSCVLKYDKDGNELWSVSLIGSCAINAMTADTDGTLYIAGIATDDAKVVLTGTDGASKEILIPYAYDFIYDMDMKSCNPGFIAKISKDGVVEALQVISTAKNPDVDLIEGAFYWAEELIRFAPKHIKISGDKVYVAATYMGDVVETLLWKGAYANVYGLIADVTSAGVFSLNKDLSGISSVANIRSKEIISTSKAEPDAIDFIVKDGVANVAFFGYGDLLLTTTAGEKVIDGLTYDPDGVGIEHALVLASIENALNVKVFDAAPIQNESLNLYNLTGAALAGNNCILGGHFYGNFPLNKDITTDASTSFVASIKMADCSVEWATPNTVASKATCMIVTGEEIKASTDVATYTLKTATGEVKADKTINYGFADADVYNDEFVSTIRANGTSVVVFSPKMSPSGIEAIKAAAANGEAKIYNLNGQRVAQPTKGLYIVNGTKVAIK